MAENIRKAVSSIMGITYLMLILNGQITHPDQIFGEVDAWNLQCLSGAIMCENGHGTEKNCLLTGAVVVNRRNSSHWNGETIEEVILAKDGGSIQYANSTRDKFRTIEASNRVKAIAKYLLIYGTSYVCPSNVMYQGKNKNAGSGLYHKEPTPNDETPWEYFCYE